MKSRKGLAIAIMEKLPRPGKSDSGGDDAEEKDEEGNEDEGAGKEAAARALCKAIENKDYAGIVEAIDDLHGMASE